MDSGKRALPPFGPIDNTQQTFNHPQAVARGLVVEVEVKIIIRFLYVFSVLPLASARRKIQAGSTGGHLQRVKDAGEQIPSMASSAH
jgi:hypothetical protein